MSICIFISADKLAWCYWLSDIVVGLCWCTFMVAHFSHSFCQCFMRCILYEYQIRFESAKFRLFKRIFVAPLITSANEPSNQTKSKSNSIGKIAFRLRLPDTNASGECLAYVRSKPTKIKIKKSKSKWKKTEFIVK